MTAVAELHSLPTPANAELVVRPLRLSRKQFALLVALARDPGRLVPKRDLHLEVWGAEPTGWQPTRTLDNHACRLRRDLADAGFGAAVVNVWGQGYRLVPTGQENRVRVRGAGPSADEALAVSVGMAVDAMEHLGQTLVALGADMARIARQQREQAEARRVARRGLTV
jgi:DNA-binding winged helix-turn-helix (wHTH) protein